MQSYQSIVFNRSDVHCLIVPFISSSTIHIFSLHSKIINSSVSGPESIALYNPCPTTVPSQSVGEQPRIRVISPWYRNCFYFSNRGCWKTVDQKKKISFVVATFFLVRRKNVCGPSRKKLCNKVKLWPICAVR